MRRMVGRAIGAWMIVGLMVALGRSEPARPGVTPEHASGSLKKPAAATLPPPVVISVDFSLLGPDRPATFVPLRPRTVETQRRIDAETLYAIGRAYQDTNQPTRALESYRKALAAAPDPLPIEKALVRVACSLGRSKLAIEYSRKALKLDPGAFDLLNSVTNYLIRNNEMNAAAALLDQAESSPVLDRHSAQGLRLEYVRGQLFTVLQRFDKAADAYTYVLDAMENPARYGLDPAELRDLIPDFAATAERIGIALLKAHRPQRALEAFQSGLTRDPRRATLHVHIAQAELALGRPEPALAEVNQDIATQPTSREPYELKAQILARLGRSSEILPDLERAARHDPNNAALQYYLASEYAAAGQVDRARTMIEHLLQKAPSAQGYRQLAEIYIQQKRLRALLKLLTQEVRNATEVSHVNEHQLQAIADDPELVAAITRTARQMLKEDPDSLPVLGQHLVAHLNELAGNTDAAVEFYQRLIKARPHDEMLKKILYGVLLDAERYTEAAQVLGDLIAKNPGRADSQALLLLAQVQSMAGETEQAVATVRKVIEAHPGEIKNQLILGEIYAQGRQFTKARDQFQKVLHESGQALDAETRDRARTNLSATYVELGAYDKAEAELEKVLATDPNHDGANNDLAYLWADRGKNLERAAQMIHKALESDPTNPAYLDTLGWVLFKQHRYQQAAEKLQEATRQPRGKDAVIFDHLGDVYRQLNQLDKARATWRKALKLFSKAAKPDRRKAEVEQKLESLGRLKEHSEVHRAPPHPTDGGR